jgi:hypothetical protein
MANNYVRTNESQIKRNSTGGTFTRTSKVAASVNEIAKVRAAITALRAAGIEPSSNIKNTRTLKLFINHKIDNYVKQMGKEYESLVEQQEKTDKGYVSRIVELGGLGRVPTLYRLKKAYENVYNIPTFIQIRNLARNIETIITHQPKIYTNGTRINNSLEKVYKREQLNKLITSLLDKYKNRIHNNTINVKSTNIPSFLSVYNRYRILTNKEAVARRVKKEANNAAAAAAANAEKAREEASRSPAVRQIMKIFNNPNLNVMGLNSNTIRNGRKTHYNVSYGDKNKAYTPEALFNRRLKIAETAAQKYNFNVTVQRFIRKTPTA